MRIGRGRSTIGVLLVLTSFIILAAPAHAGSERRRPVWYVSLGDSLSVGIQPDGNGVNHRSGKGYSDQLFATLKSSNPALQLKQLGCDVAETTATMLHGDGSTCHYPPHRSQLAAAVDFLRKNRGSVALVTIDIGANDIEPCGSPEGIDEECVKKGFISVAAHLPRILAALRLAAGPHVPIIGMNYYNPFLVAWFKDVDGPEIAQDASEKLTAFNGLLGALYRFFRMPVADVAEAFQSDDFTLLGNGVPTNVAVICGLTFMCTHLNIHATDAGYAAITEAFLKVLP